MAHKLWLAIMLFIVLAGCSAKSFQGNYSGIFKYRDSTGTKTGKTTVVFTRNAYRVTGGTDRFPAGSSGVFSTTGKNKIRFNDQNIRTADFDWNLVLNGNYDYKFKGDSLILKKDHASAEKKQYEYRLKRIE